VFRMILRKTTIISFHATKPIKSNIFIEMGFVLDTNPCPCNTRYLRRADSLNIRPFSYIYIYIHLHDVDSVHVTVLTLHTHLYRHTHSFNYAQYYTSTLPLPLQPFFFCPQMFLVSQSIPPLPSIRVISRNKLSL
jgi:hypothetical protein